MQLHADVFRNLTDIKILSSYVHLRYVDLSKNKLRDVSALNSLTHLLSVNLDNNKLTSAAVPTDLPYLQSASFASNKIRSFAGIRHPLLEKLSLNCESTNSLIFSFTHRTFFGAKGTLAPVNRGREKQII
jgi:Leucine-rich repeat (LRR) protein